MAEHLTAAERKMLRVAVNRLGEKGEWNLEELRLEFGELIVGDVSIEISGFTLGEVDQILIGDEADGIETGPLAPEAGRDAVARLGDVFRLGEHRVICGDARSPDVLRELMQDGEARMVLTDPPYNVAIVGHVTGGAHREFAWQAAR